MTTAAAALSMPTARERAMALDLLDAEPIAYLWEDDAEKAAALTEIDLMDAESEWLADYDFEQAEREYYYMAGRF